MYLILVDLHKFFAMITKGIVLICALSVASNLFAAAPDSLVKFNELAFKSEAEKNAINKYSDKPADLVDIFLTPYKKEGEVNSSAAQEKINNCAAGLREETEGKSDSKKIKIIYEQVHKIFFKVYKLDNSFADIFSRGEYNCVSASALYGIIFSKLGIPFQVKETPHHVYLIAYPDAGKILIETTSPEKGYYQFNDEMIQEYIKHLYKSKLISKEEMDTSSSKDIFNKYFFSSEDVSLTQLTGIQYFNFGVYNLDDKKYEAAVDELKKAYYLYPCERNKYTLKMALLIHVSKSDYNSMEMVSDLVTLCRYNNMDDDDVSDEVIKNEFLRIMQSQLVNNSEYANFDSSFVLISEALTDTAVKKEIDFTYHFELGRLGFLNLKDSSYEMKHLEAAYAINRNNANLQTIILGYFARLVEKFNEVSAVMGILENFSRKFPFLDNNEHFNTVKANCYLELSYRNYSLNNFSKGDNYIKEFENLYEQQNELTANDAFIEKAYMTAAGAYYKKGNYTKSKQFVKTGLNYVPHSFGLSQMLRQY
jgi:hypothetical protein